MYVFCSFGKAAIHKTRFDFIVTLPFNFITFKLKSWGQDYFCYL